MRRSALVLLLLTALATSCESFGREARTPCDLLIVRGLVLDGTGREARRADIVVHSDRIVAVTAPGDASLEYAPREVLDAEGMVVAPGFIDVHAHGDPLRTPEFRNFVAMGVTTICLGLDGSSPADAEDLAAWFDAVESRRPAVHIAACVGHGSVREQAGIGAATDPDPQAIARMAELIATALDAGAVGLSTGLEYTPGRSADAAELAAIAAPVAARGAFIASHVRNEDDGAVGAAVEELLDQCRAAPGARAHLSHAKVVHAHDADRAASILERLAAARNEGLAVTADVYPYTASYTGISILFPDWARPPEGNPEVLARRRDDLLAHLRQRVLSRNGPEATLFGSGPYAGQTLAEVALRTERPFEEVLADLGPDGASAAYFVMDEGVMETLLASPGTMVASDGSPTMRHPRGHGTFARVLARHVRERAALGLADAIHRMTGLPADLLGLDDRGQIAEGRVADLVVFDPETVQDRATFTAPFDRATGFRAVFVAGEAVVRDDVPTGARPGRALRARHARGTKSGR
jgi:N-acyl-D-amino-acid deacylase